METKRILLVDDEPGILTILKKSLQKLERPYEILTAMDGEDALALLQEQPFDLVVTDYKMAGLNGIELLERIREFQPETRTIMITAYGNDRLEAQARRLQAYEYLTKPLEIGTFRQVVQQALGDFAISQPGILVLSDDRYRQVDALLAKLERDIGASGILLVNASGQVILRRGQLDDLPVDEVVTLMSGGVATLSEAGQVIDGFENAVNLAYREGQRYDLYGLNIGTSLLLIMFISRSEYSSPLGSVWYYARRAIDQLRETLGDAEYATHPHLLDADFEQELGQELDNLFGLDFDALEFSDADKPAAEQKPADSPAPFLPREPEEHPPEETPPVTGNTSPLLSLEEAIQFGLLPRDDFFSPTLPQKGENHASL